jgi:hypothetical protein
VVEVAGGDRERREGERTVAAESEATGEAASAAAARVCVAAVAAGWGI